MFGVLAFSAAQIVAKKAFETSVAQSLKGIGEAISQRFRGNAELQQALEELEVKLKMLALPVDICAHYVERGNSALQEALGVALRVLQRIQEFQASLVQHDVARAQGDPASPDPAATTARHLRELRGLTASLDSLLPYLNLAISAAGLLASAEPCFISPSRLMSASWRLRAAAAPGAPILTLPQAVWHEERQLSAAGPSMSEAFPLCSVTVQHAAAAAAECGDVAQEGWEYELLVQQDLEDGRHHDESERAQQARIAVSSIVGIEWATTQSLNQGQNEYKPALVLHVVLPPPGCTAAGTTAAILHDATAAAAGASIATAGAALPALPPPPPALPGVATRSSSRQSSSSSAAKASGNAVSTSGASSSAASGSGAGVSSGRSSPSKTPTGGAAGSQKTAAKPALAVSAAGSPNTPAPVAAAPLGEGTGTAGAGAVRRYAIQCSSLLTARAEQGELQEEEEEVVESERAERGAGASSPAAPSAEEWAALGELEYVLRLCILESMEAGPHYAVSDERIRMAFAETTVLRGGAAAAVAAAGPAGGVAGGRGSTVRRQASTAARRRGMGGSTAATGQPLAIGPLSGGASDVDAVAAELGRRLAFSSVSWESTPPPAPAPGGRGFGSPLH